MAAFQWEASLPRRIIGCQIPEANRHLEGSNYRGPQQAISSALVPNLSPNTPNTAPIRPNIGLRSSRRLPPPPTTSLLPALLAVVYPILTAALCRHPLIYLYINLQTFFFFSSLASSSASASFPQQEAQSLYSHTRTLDQKANSTLLPRAYSQPTELGPVHGFLRCISFFCYDCATVFHQKGN